MLSCTSTHYGFFNEIRARICFRLLRVSFRTKCNKLQSCTYLLYTGGTSSLAKRDVSRPWRSDSNRLTSLAFDICFYLFYTQWLRCSIRLQFPHATFEETDTAGTNAIENLHLIPNTARSISADTTWPVMDLWFWYVIIVLSLFSELALLPSSQYGKSFEETRTVT